jgi:hypothetical protein
MGVQSERATDGFKFLSFIFFESDFHGCLEESCL